MTETPQVAIHVVRGDDSAAPLIDAARQNGAIVINLDLGRTHTLADLEHALIQAFEIPYPSRGFDSIIDFASDLAEWMPSEAGYLLAISGADHADATITQMVSRILPSILDRLRSGRVQFEVSLVADSARLTVLNAVCAANRSLGEFGASPDTVTYTAPVPVTVDGVLNKAMTS